MALAERVAFHGIRLALGLGGRLPRGLALGLFGAGGTMVHMLQPRGRDRARRNLRLVYGEEADAERLARRVYHDLGRNAADLARLERAGAEEIRNLVEATGLERLDEALGSGRGVIGVTAHLGNWELLAAYLGGRGVPLTAFAGSLFDRRLDERLVRLRARHGVNSLVRSKGGWLREGIEVLARGEMLGLLMDLRCRGEGVCIDFLGRPAKAVVGPVRLAARTGAVLLPMACWMTDDRRYRIVIDRPVDLSLDGGGAVDFKECTKECIHVLESYIRAAPTQWVWMHDRWGLGVA
ncbi:MAG: lysophospholipid acyltransferase family protein [Candidatus Eisenbacteria bacterium]